MTSQSFQESMKSNMERGMNMKDEEKLYKRNGILYPVIMSPPENLDAFFVVAQMPSRRLLVTHLHPDDIPVSFKTNKTKMLVVFRNPKDTVVSYYHFMNKHSVLPNVESWNKFFSDFMSGEVAYGSYFDNTLAWEKHIGDPNVMFVTYEELKENLFEGIKKVADFFSFPLSAEQVKGIARESTFSVMQSNPSYGKMAEVILRKVINDSDCRTYVEGWGPVLGHASSPSGATEKCYHLLWRHKKAKLSMIFVWKGISCEVGDWKNHFSEAQSKQMDEEFKKKLAGTKLEAKLKYKQYC